MTRSTNHIESIAFFTADHAAVENGKAYVNGGFWDSMRFPTFPAVATFGLVAVLHVPWSEYHKRHEFAITLQDPDGNVLPMEFKGEFQVGSAPDMKMGQPTTMSLAAMATGMPIERPGDLAFVLSVDGREIDRWIVHIMQVPIMLSGGPGVHGPSSIPGLP